VRTAALLTMVVLTAPVWIPVLALLIAVVVCGTSGQGDRPLRAGVDLLARCVASSGGVRILRQSELEGICRVAHAAERQTLGTRSLILEESRMPVQPLPITRKLSAAAKLLASAGAVGSAVLAVYWSCQIALGAPDAYRGQNRGGLLLSLAILTGSASQLVMRQSLRIALSVVSMVCLAAAIYFFGLFGT
jgi:hypothetical protein